MHDERISEQVRELMVDTFGIDESDLPESPSQATVASWTSVLQMVLLVALEERFGVTFSMDEMTTMTSLEQIVAVLQRKLALGLPA